VTFLSCPRCNHALFRVEPIRRPHFTGHVVCAVLVCDSCHNEYELLASGELELAREPAQETLDQWASPRRT
jgi:C4-type Zn-finger protein